MTDAQLKEAVLSAAVAYRSAESRWANALGNCGKAKYERAEAEWMTATKVLDDLLHEARLRRLV